MHTSRTLCPLFSLFTLLTIALHSCAPQPSIEAVNTHLATLTQEGEFSGVVLISSDGDVLMEEAYGFFNREQEVPMTAEAQFPLHVLTWQFTASAVLRLQELGALTVDDPVCEYIDHCPTAWQPITIHHLLNHTSGVSDYVQPWGMEDEQPTNSAELIERIATDDTYFAAGEDFRYSHNGYIILGHIIEVVSDGTYNDFLNQQFFEPLGMNNTGLAGDLVPYGYNDPLPPITYLDPIYRFSSSGIISTAADLAIWINALMQGEVLSQDSLEAMLTGYAATPSMDFPGSLYGYGWYIGEVNGREAYFHGGMDQGYTSFILYFPNENLTFIVLRNYGIDIYDRLEIDLAEMLLI